MGSASEARYSVFVETFHVCCLCARSERKSHRSTGQLIRDVLHLHTYTVPLSSWDAGL